jgi:hypothetical protein
VLVTAIAADNGRGRAIHHIPVVDVLRVADVEVVDRLPVDVGALDNATLGEARPCSFFLASIAFMIPHACGNISGSW